MVWARASARWLLVYRVHPAVEPHLTFLVLAAGLGLVAFGVRWVVPAAGLIVGGILGAGLALLWELAGER